MTQIVRIRGYAAPYNQIVPYGDEYQVIEPGAFSSMLRGPLPPIDIRWGSHDDHAEIIASTDARNVGFFDDDYGLGFFFDVDLGKTWGKLAEMTKPKTPCDRCSVNMILGESSIEKPFRESRVLRIKSATIDHVAIGLTRATYMQTGTWPTHCPLERAPLRIQELAERWERGRLASAARVRQVAQPPTVVSRKPAPVSLRGPSGEMSAADARVRTH